MKQAYQEALKAFDLGEIPVGAIVVCNNQIIARAHNQTELLKDVTAHAEMIALTAAANAIGTKYLVECKLYVTLEPCHMCAGASFWSQIGEVIIGASDEKRGFSNFAPNLMHPKTKLTWGVMGNECGQLINDFFQNIRNN